MLASSFFIESSSKLLVTRTGLKARSSSILGRIGRLILELLALEWRKFHTFELEFPKPVCQSWSNFMCSIIGVGERLCKVLGQTDFGTLDSGERSLPFGLLVLKVIFLKWFLKGHQMLSTVRNEPRYEKICFYHMRTTKPQISLHIRAVWSAPLFFAAWTV